MFTGWWRSRQASATSGSLETLRRWLAEKAGSSDVATLKEYVSVIPRIYLVRRFISAGQDAVVVSAAGCRTSIPVRFFP